VSRTGIDLFTPEEDPPRDSRSAPRRARVAAAMAVAYPPPPLLRLLLLSPFVYFNPLRSYDF
jgi:hypothetical protein